MASKELLQFVDHKYNCDFLQPMWHQGPCDCGLFEMMDKLEPNVLAQLPEDLLKSWRRDRQRKPHVIMEG